MFVSASYKHYFPAGVTISVGADYEHNSYHYHGAYPSSIYEIENIASAHYGKGNINYNKYEAYAYAKWLIGDFILGSSVREISQVGSKPRWSYQANVKYNLSRKNSLIASCGQYNALSLPSYFVRQVANATSRQMSVDWKSNLTARCEVNSAIYWKKESLPLYLLSGTGYQNVDNSILGIELSGKYTWSALEWFISYSYLNARMKYQDKTFSSDNDFKHMAKLTMSYLNPKILNVSVSCLVRGGLPYSPIVSSNSVPLYANHNSERYNNYFTLDLSINRFFRIGKVGVVPFVTITNITNHANQQYLYYSRDYDQQFVKLYNKRLLYIGCSVRL